MTGIWIFRKRYLDEEESEAVSIEQIGVDFSRHFKDVDLAIENLYAFGWTRTKRAEFTASYEE